MKKAPQWGLLFAGAGDRSSLQKAAHAKKNPARGRVPVLETAMSINTSSDQRLGPCLRS